MIKGKVMVNELSLVFYDDGDEQPVGEWEVVEEDRPLIYNTEVDEEQSLVFDLYDDEDDNPIFNAYVNEPHMLVDLFVLEVPSTEAAATSTMAIKVSTPQLLHSAFIDSPHQLFGVSLLTKALSMATISVLFIALGQATIEIVLTVRSRCQLLSPIINGKETR